MTATDGGATVVMYIDEYMECVSESEMEQN